MNSDKFYSLSALERKSLVIAMHIRNSMEDFHVENLTDTQMKELNQIIRKATIEGLLYYEQGTKAANSCQGKSIPRLTRKEKWIQALFFLISFIPDYWEIFGELETKKELIKSFDNLNKKMKLMYDTAAKNITGS
jgi:hypothetical protein